MLSSLLYPMSWNDLPHCIKNMEYMKGEIPIIEVIPQCGIQLLVIFHVVSHNMENYSMLYLATGKLFHVVAHYGEKYSLMSPTMGKIILYCIPLWGK